jgi:hypothetical protein
MDNLNTLKSELLVYWISKLVGTPEEELGEKGKRGILKDMDTRAAYLANPQHPVYFIYPPPNIALGLIKLKYGSLF